MPKIKRKAGARANPIVGRGRRPMPASTNPTADQVPIVCVTAAPSRIVVEGAGADWAGSRGDVSVNALDSEIQLGKVRKMREVKAGMPSRAVGVGYWRKLVVRVPVAIVCHPVAQAGETITEGKSGRSIPRFVRTTRV